MTKREAAVAGETLVSAKLDKALRPAPRSAPARPPRRGSLAVPSPAPVLGLAVAAAEQEVTITGAFAPRCRRRPRRIRRSSSRRTPRPSETCAEAARRDAPRAGDFKELAGRYGAMARGALSAQRRARCRSSARRSSGDDLRGCHKKQAVVARPASAMWRSRSAPLPVDQASAHTDRITGERCSAPVHLGGRSAEERRGLPQARSARLQGRRCRRVSIDVLVPCGRFIRPGLQDGGADRHEGGPGAMPSGAA